MRSYGSIFRNKIKKGEITPIIGVYDALSATLSNQYFDSLFCSGYGFSASRYGLPDEGFIAWKDMIEYVQNMRTILPESNIIVDIDDGYGDDKIASMAISSLENVGASAVILEDQRRPKKCGHLPGKEIIDRSEYLKRLNTILDVRSDLYVIARTDSCELTEGISRVNDYARVGADAVMVEGLSSLDSVKRVRDSIPEEVSMAINLISGGKMDAIDFNTLEEIGVNMVIYSTPCLFAAHKAVDNAIKNLKKCNGVFGAKDAETSLLESNKVLTSNLK